MAENIIISAEDVLTQKVAQDPGYIDGLIAEGQWFGGYESYGDAKLAYDQAADAEKLARKIRNDFEMTYSPIFGHRKEVFYENYNYYQSDPWTPADRVQMIADGLPPYSSSILKRHADSLLGEMRARQTDWRAEGITPESDAKADFINHFLASVAQQNDWNRTKFYVARDAIIGGVGVASAMLDPADPKGNIKLEYQRPVEFMWHLETAKNGSLDGVKMLERLYFAQRTDLEWEFPMWRKEILEMDGKMWSTVWPYLDTMIKPKSRRTTGSAVGDNSMVFDPWTARLSRNMLLKREFYHRRSIPKWRVTDGYTATHNDFDSKDQAMWWFATMKEYYQQATARMTGQDPFSVIPRMVEPRLVQTIVVDQEIWIGDKLVAVNTSEDDRLPYKFCIPEYCDGTITSYFEHGKDMQRMRGVYMIMMHKVAAGIKGKTWINDYYFKGKSQQEIDAMMISDIKPIHLSSNDPDVFKKVTHNSQPPQTLGPVLSAMMNIVSEDAETMYGGLNAIGLAENAGESGRAVDARQQAAALGTISLVEEFEHFDKQMGEDVAYLGQFMDPNIQWMIVDPAGKPQYRSMADDGIQSVKDLKYRIQIVQTLGSPTQRAGEVNRLKDVISQAPQTANVVLPIMLKKEDMDYEDRIAIEQGLNAQAEFERNIAKSQEDRANYEAQMKWQLAVRDRDIKERDQQIELIKIQTPNVSLNMKPMDTPPALLAEVVNQAVQGANADPLGVLTDQALHEKFKLDVLANQQVQRNELMTPDQKKIEAQKANPPKNVPSEQDTANRHNRELG